LKKVDNVKLEGELNRDFHIKIAESSGNPIIPLIVNPIFRLMPKIRKIVYAKIDSVKKTAISYHRKICSKIEEKDVNGAYDAMHKHLKIAEKHSNKIFNTIAIENKPK
jgi:GntR family transcriptional repressor for pyruvate dehydrogenase complex